MTIKLTDEHVGMLLIDLRDACNECLRHKTPYAVGNICTAVANLIAISGPHGGTAQSCMMHLAREWGFVPEYYANSIRVSFPHLSYYKGDTGFDKLAEEVAVSMEKVRKGKS